MALHCAQAGCAAKPLMHYFAVHLALTRLFFSREIFRKLEIRTCSRIDSQQSRQERHHSWHHVAVNQAVPRYHRHHRSAVNPTVNDTTHGSSCGQSHGAATPQMYRSVFDPTSTEQVELCTRPSCTRLRHMTGPTKLKKNM